MLMFSSLVVSSCLLLISQHVMPTPVTLSLAHSLVTRDTTQSSVAFPKTMADNTKLYAAGGVAIGSLFVYSALKNKSVLSAAQQTVKGQNPIAATTLPNAEPFSAPSPIT